MDGEIGNKTEQDAENPFPFLDENNSLMPYAVKSANSLDDMIRQSIARMTGGASPIAFMTAAFDWTAHMAVSPGRAGVLQAEFAKVWMQAAASFLPHDHDGDGKPDFDALPALDALDTAFEGLDRLVDEAVAVHGLSRRHQDLLRFATRLAIEPYRPENNLLTNKAALELTVEEHGANLARGWMNLIKDMTDSIPFMPHHLGEGDEEPEFKVGKNLAVTPGKVVYRNDLFELLQYTPQTETVKKEPILIVPAWIMKYYILDLSPDNSMVKYLVSQGYTVFMVSWRNPGPAQSELSFDDYRKQGFLTAIDAVCDITGAKELHVTGYCLGGTLSAIGAAAMARDGDRRCKTLTLLAAQTDFRDAGELLLFIDEDQLAWLEASMEANEGLGAEQMASAFKLLRAKDLIWRRWRQSYLLGQKDQTFDLLAWNQDATRMPKKMHAEYLRKLFLNNDFVQGRFEIDEKPVAVSDIRAPIFSIGTEKDHVAPWRSVYKLHLFADTEVTFVLTNGGHNAGVVSEPGHPHRHHAIHTKQDCEHYIEPDQWLEIAEQREGSWWPTWVEWLDSHNGEDITPPATKRARTHGNLLPSGKKLPDAPGKYVLEMSPEEMPFF